MNGQRRTPTSCPARSNLSRIFAFMLFTFAALYEEKPRASERASEDLQATRQAGGRPARSRSADRMARPCASSPGVKLTTGATGRQGYLRRRRRHTHSQRDKRPHRVMRLSHLFLVIRAWRQPGVQPARPMNSQRPSLAGRGTITLDAGDSLAARLVRCLAGAGW